MGCDDPMKVWPCIIGILVILTLFCSPVLAISKSDLISYYKTQSTPAMPIPTPTVTPTPAPTQNSQVPFGFYPSGLPWNFNSFFQPDKIAEYVAKKGNRFIWESSDPGVVIFNDIGVGKPNIYLYSDRDLIAQVQLAPEEDITISEPVYQPGKGWRAEIRNGSLNGIGDFLFYEGLVPDSGWQKEEGYVIRAEHREQDMASMLGHYNFNDKETVEFIDYWSQHLANGVDYVFYPQETGAVDRVMPLSISPEPDYVMRIWFYAEPLVSTPEPVKSTDKIIREGFYVVEWGVMIR
jgi:hypothetical protein